MRPVFSDAEDAAAFDRMETAITRALDSARRAEGLGERDIFISGWGVINTLDLAEVFRLRAERLRAQMNRFIDAVNAKTEAAADAVESVGAAVDEGGDKADEPSSSNNSPRRGPGRPRRSPEPGAV